MKHTILYRRGGEVYLAHVNAESVSHALQQFLAMPWTLDVEVVAVADRTMADALTNEWAGIRLAR